MSDNLDRIETLQTVKIELLVNGLPSDVRNPLEFSSWARDLYECLADEYHLRNATRTGMVFGSVT